MTTYINHFIGGSTAEGSSTRTAPVFNPATGVIQKEVRLGSAADIDTAVKAAAAAFPGWADSSLAKRQAILFAFRELLNARKGELAEILTSEHGKV
ncbi:MAG: aldehyde dehydrogenase family protein, partial [Mycetocola sp.]